jgi:hypothetical protein
MCTVAIHQPQYIPWSAYFDKILRSDIFVLLDDVQFNKNGLQNRNQIKTPQGRAWLTLPIKHLFGQKINEVEIDNIKIKEKHLRSIKMNYSNANDYTEINYIIESVLQKDIRLISQISIGIIKKILSYLEYNGKVVLSSSLSINSTGSNLVLDICKSVGARKYLSGMGALNYLERKDFEQNDIDVKFQQFDLPEYKQCFPKVGFIPDLSIIDLLFNEGKESINIIKSGMHEYLNWEDLNLVKYEND